MTFIQTLSFVAKDEGEVTKLMDDWQKDTPNAPGFRRSWILKDRDKPNAFMISAEFSSYDEAMKNSNRPETDAMAKKLFSLVDGEVEYRNFDLIKGEE
jgi:quinol monooxygenase YgiN